MFRQLVALVVVSIASISISCSGHALSSDRREPCAEDHQPWVSSSLQKMQTIRPGMTRDDLLKIFTTEGGISTPLHRRFVSRDCPYFKVDVEFRRASGSDRDSDERDAFTEDRRDVITKISQPFLQFSIAD